MDILELLHSRNMFHVIRQIFHHLPFNNDVANSHQVSQLWRLIIDEAVIAKWDNERRTSFLWTHGQFKLTELDLKFGGKSKLQVELVSPLGSYIFVIVKERKEISAPRIQIYNNNAELIKVVNLLSRIKTLYTFALRLVSDHLLAVATDIADEIHITSYACHQDFCKKHDFSIEEGIQNRCLNTNVDGARFRPFQPN